MKNLYKYDMGIFPRRLYICYKPDLEEFANTFYGVNPDENGIIDITPSYLDQRYRGSTIIDCAGVAMREDDELGVNSVVFGYRDLRYCNQAIFCLVVYNKDIRAIIIPFALVAPKNSRGIELAMTETNYCVH